MVHFLSLTTNIFSQRSLKKCNVDIRALQTFNDHTEHDKKLKQKT